MIKEEYRYSELTLKIIGYARTVPHFPGNGFQEVIYQRALAMELKIAKKFKSLQSQKTNVS